MNEIWKDVERYEGSYQVSNCGRVRSLDRAVRNGLDSKRPVKGQMLKLWIGRSGYYVANLWSGNQMVHEYIHRLVLQAFAGSSSDGHECNHRDGNKANNHIENLEWVTSSENKRHARRNGLASRAPNAKLSPEIAEMIRKVYALGEHSQSQAGLMFGVSRANIGMVIRGETWVTGAEATAI